MMNTDDYLQMSGIEIAHSLNHKVCVRVALRKESVDRNQVKCADARQNRAWIEIEV